MCSTHENKQIEFICDEHNEFLCSLCLWDHAKHVDSTKTYLEEELIKDIQRVELKLSEMNKNIWLAVIIFKLMIMKYFL